MDTVELAKLIASLPFTVLLVLVLVGGYREWWVYGGIYRRAILSCEARIAEEKARAERWEGLFLQLNAKIDTLQSTTQQVTRVVSGSPVLTDKLQSKLVSLESQMNEIREALKKAGN